MIDERHEEAASLYALDLLEGAERQAFETELAKSPELQRLVAELREATADLALTAPQTAPSPELRARVLASVAALPQRTTTTASAPGQSDDADGKVVHVEFSRWSGWVSWAAAACFAFASAYLGNRYVGVRAEVADQRSAAEVARIEAQSLRQRLESEQIVSLRQLAELKAGNEAAALARAETQKLGEQLDALKTTFTRQLAELEKKAGELTARQLAQITDLQKAGDIANLKIAKLAMLAGNSQEAVAIAVWNPLKQEGVLNVEKLPALQQGEDYELWVINPGQYGGKPVSAGLVVVDAKGAGHVHFRPDQPVTAATTFAISREVKGGVPKTGVPVGPNGPVVAAGTL